MQGSISEVARLRRQIELECEAAKLGMSGPAITASHKFIEKRYNNIASYQKELEQQIGEKEAMKVVYEIYVEVIG